MARQVGRAFSLAQELHYTMASFLDLHLNSCLSTSQRVAPRLRTLKSQQEPLLVTRIPRLKMPTEILTNF